MRFLFLFVFIFFTGCISESDKKLREEEERIDLEQRTTETNKIYSLCLKNYPEMCCLAFRGVYFSNLKYFGAETLNEAIKRTSCISGVRNNNSNNNSAVGFGLGVATGMILKK